MDKQLAFAELHDQVKIATLMVVLTSMNESGKLSDSVLSAALSKVGITPQNFVDEIAALGDEDSPAFKQFEHFVSQTDTNVVDWKGVDECEWIEPKHAPDYISGQATLIYDMLAIGQVLPYHCPIENKEAWVILIPDAVYGLKPTLLRDSPIYRNLEQAMKAVDDIVSAQFNREIKPKNQEAA